MVKVILSAGLSLLITLTVFAQAPTTQASSIVFSSVKSDEITLSWTNGDGDARLVVATLGSVTYPSNFTNYAGNFSFGAGTDLGSGTYAVYDGTGSSVTVTDLSPNTNYTFRIFEYNSSGGPYYNISGLGGNPSSQSSTCATAGTDQQVCSGSTALSGSSVGIGTGAWTELLGDGNGSFLDPTDPATTFSGTPGVQYTLTWTVTGSSCDGEDHVVITLDQAPTIADAGVDNSSCVGVVVLSANTPTVGSGSWSVNPVSGVSFSPDNLDPNATIFAPSGTTYTVTWTITNGVCTPTSDDVLITMSNPPTANAGTDQSSCANTVILDGSGSGPGVWTIYNAVSTTGTSFSDNTSVNSNFTGLDGNWYELQYAVTQPGCPDATDVVRISFETPIGNDTTINICDDGSGFSFDLQANLKGAPDLDTDFTWTISASASTTGAANGSGDVVNQYIDNISTNTDEDVIYTITPISNNLGCTGPTYDLTVWVGAYPTLDPNLQKTVVSGTPIQLTLAEAPGSIAAAKFNITNISPHSLIPNGSNAMTGNDQLPNAIYNDSFTNLGASLDSVIYDIYPVSSLGCVGAYGTARIYIPKVPVLLSDSLALVAIHDATNHGAWNDSSGWEMGPLNTWAGVTLTAGRVTSLNLDYHNMTGPLPPQIGDLTALQYLSLLQNNLSGPIPDEIGNLQNLRELTLSYNKLSGNIPSTIGSIDSLRKLVLRNNQLTGSIPPSIGQLHFLTELHLSNNQLSGPIPVEIGDIPALFIADLSNNQLTGSIPVELGVLSTLYSLDLSNNQISGNIPDEISGLAALNDLNLSSNQLSGPIPVGIGQLIFLSDIELSNNNLSGPVPDTIAALPNLQTLYIDNNQFTSLPVLQPLFGGDVSYNYLDFSSLEPNASGGKMLAFGGLQLMPQKPIPAGGVFTVASGAPIALSFDAGGTKTHYAWYNVLNGAIGDTTKNYNIASATSANTGSYYVEATNDMFPGTSLTTTIFDVRVQSTTAGPDPGYYFVDKIGAEKLGIPDYNAKILATGAAGNLYTFDASSQKINKFDGAGAFIRSIDIIGGGVGQLLSLTDLAVDADDQVFAYDAVNTKLVGYDAAGALLFENTNVPGDLIAVDNEGHGAILVYSAQSAVINYYSRSTGYYSSFQYLYNVPGSANYTDFDAEISGYMYFLQADSSRVDTYGGFYFGKSLYPAIQGAAPGSIADVTYSSDRQVYIQSEDGAVYHYDSGNNNWNFINVIGTSELIKPKAIVVNASDELVVADEFVGFVKYDLSGTLISILGPAKNSSGQFNRPLQAAQDSHGNRYVCDYYNGRIQKFDAQGNFILQFGTIGTGVADLKYPISIAIDSLDMIYVADYENHRIQKFDETGAHLGSFGTQGAANGQFDHPFAVAISGNEIYVVDEGNSRIQKFNLNGTFLLSFGAGGVGAGQFTNPGPLAVEDDGKIIVGNDFPAKIMRFNSDGTFVEEFNLSNSSPVISGLATDNMGAIYLANHDGVVKLDKQANVIVNVANHGHLDGELDFATSVSSNSFGDTLWISSAPNRVSIFAAGMRFAAAADSLALVDLFNATAGGSWIDSTNWLTKSVDQWFGIDVRAGKILGIDLSANNLNGTLPATLSSLKDLEDLDLSFNILSGDLTPVGDLPTLKKLNLSKNNYTGDVPPLPMTLQQADLSFNQFTSLAVIPPTLASMTINDNVLDTLGAFSTTYLTDLAVDNNKLSFGDLEPNASIPNFTYNNQDSLEVKKSLLLHLTDSISVISHAGGASTVYTWYKNDVAISGETAHKLFFASIGETDDGIYRYSATNTLLPGLTLFGRSTEFKVSSLRRDSLALVALYNATNGGSWTSHSNWNQTPLRDNDWEGVFITNNRVTGVSLAGHNLTDSIPQVFDEIENLQTVDFAGNNLTYIPNLTALPNTTSFDVSGNKLGFKSLENNVGLTGLAYNNQQDIGDSTTMKLAAKSPLHLEVSVDGDHNHYQWTLSGQPLPGDTLNVLDIEQLNKRDEGKYICEITNRVVTDLVLRTAYDSVYLVTTLSGTVFAAENEPATLGGDVTLLRINNGGAYEKFATQPLNDDGTFEIPDVRLDNYKLLSFLDTLKYERALPTYYKGTIFWEEGDTLVVTESLDSLDIISQYKPTDAVLTGDGIIRGVVFEPDPNGRVKTNKRVEGAGVTARRVERSGRGKEDVKLTLIGYQFTNENGEFTFTKLPSGEYRLNIQIPGYPMDENSFLSFNVGTGLDAEVVVEATVEDGLIVVRQLVITHIWSQEDYHAEIYPNPTANYLQIEFANESLSRSIQVYDLAGKQVATHSATRKKESINVSAYNRGTYVVNIHDKGNLVKSLQLVIE